MTIEYIVNARMPTEKAHGVQIMQMGEAIASLGHTVQLVVSNRTTGIHEDPLRTTASAHASRYRGSGRSTWCGSGI